MNEITSLYILSLIIFFINMAIIYKSINKKCMRPIYIVLLFMLKCSVFITMLISNIGTFPVILSDIVIILSGTFAFEFTEYEKIYCILIGSGSLITSYIYTLLMSYKLECIYNLLIIYSISFILNILITFCISQFNNSPIKTIIVLVISYLASMCIIASIGTFDYKKILIGAGIEFIIINVLFGITIKMNIKVNKDEYRNNILNEQIVIYRNEIATKNRYNQKIKSIEHDINNHIISIRNMISDNRNNEAVRYIDEVFNILNNHDNILDTGNIEIDSIMNTKLDEMSSYGITYCHNIMIPCGMNINAMSIVIILGNLLDNSIEAVRKIKESAVNKPVAIFTLAIAISAFAALLIFYIDGYKTMTPVLFESVSALSTTGLSLGITPSLSIWGKIIVMILMFIGRVGYLTLFMSVGSIDKGRYGLIDLPTSDVTIG